MTVPFNNIPQNLRVPLFYAEMDNSAAGYFQVSQRALLVGQKLAAGTGIANKPVIVASESNAIALCGRGSMLARMFNFYRANDLLGEIWLMPLDEPPAGVVATGTIAFAGTATAAGTLSLWIAGQRVQTAVASGDASTAVATAVAAAVNAALDLPVTASVATSTVTLTCRWKGDTGNDITIISNYRGAAGNEITPAGITPTITAMASGTGAPVLTTAIAAMGDDEYDFVVMPFTDTTSLDALKTEMNDTAGRWSYARQVYGHVYSAKRGILSALTTFGGARNDQHATVAAIEANVPTPCWEYAAAYGARNAVYIKADPARPTQTGELTNVLPALAGQRFTLTERQSLLNYGVATSYFGGGAVRIERAVTTYQKNTWGQSDPSYLDSETLHTSTYVLRYLRQRITSKYARHKLANDGTRFGEGSAIVTPSIVKGELIAAYRDLEENGIVENANAFKAALIVERPTTDPNRLDVLFAPDYINQLRIFAVLAQFRLQF